MAAGASVEEPVEVAVDNIKITNLDDSAKLTDVEFQSAAFVSEDYDYQPSELVFRPQDQINTKQNNTNSLNWQPVIIAGFVSVAIILCAATVSVCLKKRKSKEVA